MGGKLDRGLQGSIGDSALNEDQFEKKRRGHCGVVRLQVLVCLRNKYSHNR